ncbi:MAG: glycosyltransferase [Candidatus Lokiarchaeota archaeon]|nr:glycosyltransferase [Candidatus Lokiarchaeota archaeon]
MNKKNGEAIFGNFMNILILGNEKYPSNRPMLIELWQKEMTMLGYRLYWVMQSSKNSFGVKVINKKNNIFYVLPNVTIKNIIYFKFISKFLNFSLKFICSLYLIKKYRIKVIHVHNGAEEGFVSLILKKIFKLKYVYTYTSHFMKGYEFIRGKNSIELGLRKIKFGLSNKLYLNNLSKSDLVFPISENLRNELNRSFEIPLNKMMVVSESASTYFMNFSEQSNKKMNQKIVNTDYLNLIYIGSLGKNRKIDFIVDSFQILLNDFKNVQLYILGMGETKEDIPALKKYIYEKKLQNMIFLKDRVYYYDIPEIVSQFDIGLSPIPPAGYYVFATPTKCIEYMSLKVPVVANIEIDDQKKLIENSGGGILTSYDVVEYANGILKLLTNDNIRKKCAESGFQWLKENRNFKLTAKKIHSELNKQTVSLISQ